MSETRKVGVCAFCGTSVLLRLDGVKREARCSCGATVIRPRFFQIVAAVLGKPVTR